MEEEGQNRYLSSADVAKRITDLSRLFTDNMDFNENVLKTLQESESNAIDNFRDATASVAGKNTKNKDDCQKMFNVLVEIQRASGNEANQETLARLTKKLSDIFDTNDDLFECVKEHLPLIDMGADKYLQRAEEIEQQAASVANKLFQFKGLILAGAKYHKSRYTKDEINLLNRWAAARPEHKQPIEEFSSDMEKVVMKNEMNRKAIVSIYKLLAAIKRAEAKGPETAVVKYKDNLLNILMYNDDLRNYLHQNFYRIEKAGNAWNEEHGEIIDLHPDAKLRKEIDKREDKLIAQREKFKKPLSVEKKLAFLDEFSEVNYSLYKSFEPKQVIYHLPSPEKTQSGEIMKFSTGKLYEDYLYENDIDVSKFKSVSELIAAILNIVENMRYDNLLIKAAFDVIDQANNFILQELNALKRIVNNKSFRNYCKENNMSEALEVLDDCIINIPSDLNNLNDIKSLYKLYNKANNVCKFVDYPLLKTCQQYGSGLTNKLETICDDYIDMIDEYHYTRSEVKKESLNRETDALEKWIDDTLFEINPDKNDSEIVKQLKKTLSQACESISLEEVDEYFNLITGYKNLIQGLSKPPTEVETLHDLINAHEFYNRIVRFNRPGSQDTLLSSINESRLRLSKLKAMHQYLSDNQPERSGVPEGVREDIKQLLDKSLPDSFEDNANAQQVVDKLYNDVEKLICEEADKQHDIMNALRLKLREQAKLFKNDPLVDKYNNLVAVLPDLIHGMFQARMVNEVYEKMYRKVEEHYNNVMAKQQSDTLSALLSKGFLGGKDTTQQSDENKLNALQAIKALVNKLLENDLIKPDETMKQLKVALEQNLDTSSHEELDKLYDTINNLLAEIKEEDHPSLEEAYAQLKEAFVCGEVKTEGKKHE